MVLGPLRNGGWGLYKPSPQPSPISCSVGVGARFPVRPTSVNADPCDPETVEQTHSEITQCSIKGWGLKVGFVLIGRKPSSLPRWLSRLFRTCNMDWEDEHFPSEWVAVCFARSCHRQEENGRSGAGGRWMEVPVQGTLPPDFDLESSRYIRYMWWLVAFSSFPWKSENFQPKQFGNKPCQQIDNE